MHGSIRTVSPARKGVARFLCPILGLLVACGCTHRTPIAAPNESPYDRVTLASLDGIATGSPSSTLLESGAYRWSWPWQRGVSPAGAGAPFVRIDTVLQKWLADSAATKGDTFIVTFRDTLRLPRFPEPDVNQPPGSAVNTTKLDAAALLITGITALRDSQYHADTLGFASHYQATVLQRFWIVRALKVVMPLGAVDSLAHRPDVAFIQRNRTDSSPPSWVDDGDDDNDPKYARDMMSTDAYYHWGLSYGWIGLLDTGVRSTHELFDPTVPAFDQLGDCVSGNADCVGGNPGDVDANGHGTSSAAILAANNMLRPRFRGVTAGKLSAYRVYALPSAGARPKLIVSAALAGFQRAAARLDPIVVAEMQDNSPAAAAIGDAADHAFETGIAIIAANGDLGASSFDKLSNPARSRRALGVGAWDVMDQRLDPTTSFGSTIDGRNKPDVLAPSGTETAGSSSNTATNYLGSTSGATPYAAGAAALLRNWLVWAAGSTDPGQVYAQMILSGEKAGPFDASGAEGVGRLKLPTNGWCYFGKIELTDTYRECSIPIDIRWSDIKNIQAAIWWPETLVAAGGFEKDTHNDINITLLDASGVEQKRSWSVHGVYERCDAPVTVSDGVWHLKIDSASFKLLPQTVYWTVALRR